MQEEIEHKTVNLAISTTKLSARTLLRGMQFLLRQYDKHASQGKQSMKRLVRQNRGVTNVEIQKTSRRRLPTSRISLSGSATSLPRRFRIDRDCTKLAGSHAIATTQTAEPAACFASAT